MRRRAVVVWSLLPACVVEIGAPMVASVWRHLPDGPTPDPLREVAPHCACMHMMFRLAVLRGDVSCSQTTISRDRRRSVPLVDKRDCLAQCGSADRAHVRFTLCYEALKRQQLKIRKHKGFAAARFGGPPLRVQAQHDAYWAIFCVYE